jgi:hypothetical protein
LRTLPSIIAAFVWKEAFLDLEARAAIGLLIVFTVNEVVLLKLLLDALLNIKLMWVSWTEALFILVAIVCHA